MKAPEPKNTSPQFTLGEIAGKIRGDLRGPPDRMVRGVRPIASAGPEDITFLDNPMYLQQAAASKAGAIILARGAGEFEGPATIRVDEPYVALAMVLELFHPRRREAIGVSPEARVGQGTTIGPGTNVHPGAAIGCGVRIGEGTDIFPGAVIGDGVIIGSNCIIYPNVTIYHGCRIGDRVAIHAGAVIGADGFGYAQRKHPDDPREPVTHHKIPQVGIVVIEDDVEIGANTTIDRAALEETRIGRGTKIDNLVMVAHNCRIGRHAILIGQAGISGSTEVGDYVTIAGQAGLVGHITIGDGATIGAQAGVTKSVAPGKTVIGSPAMDGFAARRAYALIEHLPEYRRKIEELERRIAKIEEGRAGM